MGDTNLAKALPLSDPAVFDDRVISFLNGLKYLDEPRYVPGPSVSGVDIRELFASLHPTLNSERISALGAATSLAKDFGVFQSVDHTALAVNAGGTGTHLQSYTDELRIAQLGPKVWGIRARASYPMNSVVVGNDRMRWAFNVYDIENPVYVAFLSVLPSAGQVIASRVWRAQDGTVRYGNVGIYKASSLPGMNGAESIFFDIARAEGADYDAGIGYGDSEWFATSTQGRNTSQLNLSISGILILP